jgi:hypothetical protein
MADMKLQTERQSSLQGSELIGQAEGARRMYYRVAIQVDPLANFQWKSTVLSSLSTLFQWLQLYRALPPDRLRVFSSSSREEMNEQLVRENQGLASPSVTAAQFLQERRLCSPGPAQGVSAPGTQQHQEESFVAISTMVRSNESTRAVHSLDERSMNSLERRRLELELGPGGDHDVPYNFVRPPSTPQVLAWMTLLARVQRGELHS